MEATVEKIVIIGGGICGLATALALHKKGKESIVLERSERLRAAGAAIIIQPNGWRALDHLGVAPKLRKTALPIQSGQVIAVDAGSRKEIPLGDGELRCLKRSDLMNALAEKLPENTLRFGCQVLSVTFDPLTRYWRLQLQDGTLLKAKVVIGCDGLNSVTAQNMLLDNTRLFRTCVTRGFTSYNNQTHQFGSQFLVYTKGSVQLGLLPLTEYLVYWFLTRELTQRDLTVAKDQGLVKKSSEEAVEGFPPEVVELVRDSDESSLHLTDLRYRPPWELLRRRFSWGTAAVAGDAVHAMGPFLAQGGSASLEDAVVLGRCLTEKGVEVEAALDRYARERKMRVFWLSMQTFLIGTLLDAPAAAVKAFCVAVLVLLFRDPIGHTRYDCGRL